MNEIKNQINREINRFKEDIVIIPGFRFNQPERINTNYRLYFGKYLTGDIETDEDGRVQYKKWFRNITRSPCNTARKEMNFSTRDININSRGTESIDIAWIFQKALQVYMAENDFGTMINEVLEILPTQGSAVWKFIDGVPYTVDLRNFIVEPDANDLNESRYIIEKHIYNPREFEKAAEEFGWDLPEGILRKARERKENIIVYERYGEAPNSMIDDAPDDDDYSMSRIYMATTEADDKTRDAAKIDTVSGRRYEVIKSEVIDDIPYEEFHLEKIPGRWLGVSIPELIEDPQLRMNEIANLKSKASYWAALQIFQSRDPNVDTNLLDFARNGQVYKSTDDIRPIDTRERNLQAYQVEEQDWVGVRDEMTFAFESLRGKPLPARTPLGATEMSYGASKQYYEMLRDNIALRFKKIIKDRIIPKFIDTYLSQESILNLVGDDLDRIKDVIVRRKTREAALKMIKKLKRPLTSEELSILRKTQVEQFKKKKDFKIKLNKERFENLDYDISITITGESEDIRTQQASLQVILQAYMANPEAVRQDPAIRKMISDMADKSGLNLREYLQDSELDQPRIQEMINQIGKAGGGMSSPRMQAQPQRGEQQREL